MRTARFTLASLLLVALFVTPVFAQDLGIPDTCRFEPTATTWEVNTLDDTLFSVELYGYSDAFNVTGISVGFRMETSTGGGTGHDDSLLIVQEWLPNASGFGAGAFVSPSISYLDESYGGFGWGYNGFALGVVTFGAPAFATVGSPVKMGDLTLKLVDPTNMSANFEIEIDSSFFPPAGAFKYSVSGGTGFPPQFLGSTITVVNNLGQAAEEPEIGVDPASIVINATEGDVNPTATLDISNIGTGDLNWTVSDDADWLTLDPTSGVNAGTVTLTVDLTGLSPNQYTAEITVTDPNAVNDPVTVPVTLEYAAGPPTIELVPDSLGFAAVEGGANPDPQVITVNNIGGSQPLAWTATEGVDWVSVSPASGGGGDVCSVFVDITGVAAGSYETTITFADGNATNSPQTAKVTLEIAEPAPEISLDPSVFNFEATVGGANPDAQVLNVFNTGGQTLDWTATDDADWLSLSPATGANGGICSLYVDITGLAVGVHTAEVTVTDPAATNSPQTAEVTLTINDLDPVISVTPTEFHFDAFAGGANPADQILTINNTGGGVLNWEVTDNADWLTLAPTTGTEGETTTLSVDITGLSAGAHVATITVSDAGGVAPSVEVEVLLVLGIEFTIVPGENPDPVTVPIDVYPGELWEVLNQGTIPSWLTLDPLSGTQGTDDLTITVDITDPPLDPGDYSYTIQISLITPSKVVETLELPIQFTVPPPAPFIVLDPDAITVDAELGGANPNDTTVELTNGGGGTLSWAAATDVAWMSVDPTSGDGAATLTLSFDISSGIDSAATYTGHLIVTDAAAANSPESTVVTLIVTEPEVPEIGVFPPFVNFEMDEGVNPIDKTIDIRNDGTGTLNFTLQNDSSWLVLSDPSGSATPGNPFTVTLSIDADDRDPGMYHDTLWVIDGNAINSPYPVPVSLQINEVVVEVLDSVIVGTASGVPGEEVVVPVDFINTVDISGIDLPLEFVGDVTLDSVSFVGSRIDGIPTSTPVDIDNAANTVVIGVIATGVDLIPAGDGLLCNLHFTIDGGATPGNTVPIETITILGPPDHELMFTMDVDPFVIYPGFVPGEISIIEPCLAEITDELFFTAELDGPNPADQTFEIVNCGEGALFWTVSDDADWLSVAPLDGEGNATITVSVDITGLDLTPPPYIGTITIEAEGAPNSPQTVPVELEITPPPAEDLAGDVEEIISGAPIVGATVELWDSYPDGNLLQTTSTDADGFMFDNLTGDYVLRVYKESYYPTVVDVTAPDETVLVELTPVLNVTPTPDFIFIYCDGFATLDGYPIQPGDVIETWDSEGNLCGQDFVETAGEYGLLTVYGDDFTTPAIDEGMDEGEAVTVTLNGYDVTSFLTDPVIFDPAPGGGDVTIEACFEAQTEETICIWLYGGWNLISWNVDTDSDAVLDVISSIAQEVDLILGFEGGGLVWDPELVDFSTLDELDHYHGFWFRISPEIDSLEFCVTGVPVNAATPIMLEQGWNLASYLPSMPYSTGDALSSIVDDLVIALGYDQTGGLTWDPDDPISSTLNTLMPGKGYWYKVDDDVDLTYPANGPFAMYAIEPDNTSQKFSTFSKVVPTNRWVNVYGSDVTVDGNPIPAGTIVDAVTEDGAICGTFVVHTTGKLGFMSVYGDDATTSAIEGLNEGDSFELVVNGVETEETFTWTGHAENIEIGALNSIGGFDPIKPVAFELEQNYPNPFNPSTTIGYELGVGSHVTLTVYNILGEQVTTLVDEYQGAGNYKVEWNGADSNGRTVSSGVYFYKIDTGDFTETKKMMLMK